MTPVTTPFFMLQLPGNWMPIRTADPTLWQYQSRSE